VQLSGIGRRNDQYSTYGSILNSLQRACQPSRNRYEAASEAPENISTANGANMSNPPAGLADQLKKSTSALQLSRDLREGKISAREVMSDTYARINAINPQVNALVNLLTEDQADHLATIADQIPIAERGPLHAIPMAPKDAVEVKGFPTTWGFVPYANNIASTDDAQASRLRKAGAIFIGHSNMPEFGLGSHTFNNLFGSTLNPYDLDKTPGGSSGGAAVALATSMLPLADGSDMGGSLRNPASFCNVVGFRPSIGRVPAGRAMPWFGRLSTTGPMAKTVADATLLFAVQAGPDQNDPLTLPESGDHFLDALMPPEHLNGYRIAYSPDLYGLPIEPEVATIICAAADVMSNLGAAVEHNAPDLRQAMSVFQTQRAAGLAILGNTLDRNLPDWRSHAKDTAVWNIEKGQALCATDILQSEITRGQIYARVADFFSNYDALILPAAQVTPFSIDIDWIREINGMPMTTYIDWMTICCAITVTGLPAISVPAGFTSAGLPVGLQIVGKPRGDLDLLKLAHTFERATQFGLRQPEIDPSKL
jgi:amidase